MATEQETPVDLDEFESADVSDEQSGNINLDPGEHIMGEITAYKPWAGDYGLLEIDGRTLWLNKAMQDQLIAGLVVGSHVAHVKDDEEQSFTNNDDEEVTYYERELRFPKGGDD